MGSELFSWKIPQQNLSTMYKQRSGHTGAYYKKKLYFFHGETNSKLITNTMLIFDIESESWSIKGSIGGPSCRRSHTTSIKDDKVYLFGGDNDYLNDMYVLSMEKLIWQKITPKNELNVPCGRRYHCSAIVGNYLYIFGGEDTVDTMLNDLHKFNLKTLEWTKLNFSGSVPKARRYSTFIPRGNSIFLFAGRDEVVRFNDLWEFNTITENWNCIQTYGHIPTLRSAHISVICGDSMFIFGGNDGNKINDIQEYDFLTSNWKFVDVFGEVKPSARYWHVGIIDSENTLYIHGGGDHDSVESDFYQIKLRSKVMNLQKKMLGALKNQELSDVLLITY